MKREVKSALVRFLRVIIPQIPTFVAAVGGATETLSFPGWVTPTLLFVGACATALDKFMRDMEWY